MTWQRNLLWVDSGAGAVAGSVMLLASPWLAEWYQLPHGLLYFMGAANLAYASYSYSLARRTPRPKALIHVLIGANTAWAVACFTLSWLHRDSATLLGSAHLVGEGLFVGGLASLEWRWRELLILAPQRPADLA